MVKMMKRRICKDPKNNLIFGKKSCGRSWKWLINTDHLENVARIYLEHLRIQWSNNLIYWRPSISRVRPPWPGSEVRGKGALGERKSDNAWCRQCAESFKGWDQIGTPGSKWWGLVGFMGFNGDFMVFNGDFMVFNGDFMVFDGDLMVFDGDLMVVDGDLAWFTLG